MVLIDKEKKTIDYFDSKGITSENKIFKDGTTMKSILDELSLICQNKDQNHEYTIQENATILQLDSHNCGAFVSWFAVNRITKTAQDIITQGTETEHHDCLEFLYSLRLIHLLHF
jgi:hypothetical protein